ncbi:nucleoside phosphorylase domain-containing protein [Cyathus striatus]|nr:nucleoside phosphorylase domain-containing protein [Cyathus striatus]
MSHYKDINYTSTLDAITSVLPEKLRKPHVGIICGSGLNGLADVLREVKTIPYENIPGFGRSTVVGHKSALAFGLLGAGEGVPVVAMLGRFHPYEGHPMSIVTYPVRVMAKLGVKNIIITNAAGSLNPKISVGTSPQTSPDHPRFLPTSDAYSPALRRLAFIAAHQQGIESSALEEGTYAWVSGPTYESPAEGRFLRNAGADIVGMSTVPEVFAAREEGLNVLVFSLVTNFVVIPETYRSIKEEVAAELMGKSIELPELQTVSHEEVLAIGKEKAGVMKGLVERTIELISQHDV